MRQKALIPLLATAAGFGASAALLTVIQTPFDLSFLAWVAWVPFVLACGPEVPTRRLLLTAYLAGLAYWVGNLYWLQIVTLPGYISFSLAQGLYWPVLAVGARYARRKGWPLLLAAPLLFVGAEAWQGVLYTGFHWYYLAHSQYQNLPLIQICDLFGTAGLSVVIAAANGAVAGLIVSLCQIYRSGPWGPGLRRPAVVAPVAVVAALLAATLLYGRMRLAETPACQTDGPRLGAVQPNVPSHVKEAIENGRLILDGMIADSTAAVAAGAAMAAWPETMVLAPINAEYRAYCQDTSDPWLFHRSISEHAATQQTPVLVGSHAAAVGIRDGQYTVIDQYNSAYLYRPDGSVDPQRYDKIHLVPFGEYIPFKESFPPLYRLIMWLSPYDYDYNLTHGTDYTRFSLPVGDRTYGFGVLICYEDTDPTVTRKLVLDEAGQKADWLVNISNDGWYVFYRDGVLVPTVELAQRTAISVFRCVENRIAIIRSVNTGISCLIEPTGRIRDGFEAGTLPDRAMDRQGVSGWFVDTVPIDSRVTFFSRYGRWPEVVLGAGLAILTLLAIADGRKKPRKKV